MVISLLTDFGLSDNFVGVTKAVILNINSEVELIDISHGIRPHGIKQAAFLLKHSFKFFPRGTIHVVVVDPTVGSTRKNILVETDNYYFIAPDNGVLSLALREDKIRKIIQISNDEYFLKPTSDTFQGRDIFAPIAAYLSEGISITRFGKTIKGISTVKLPKVTIKKNCLIGEVVYFDNFGNLITNIDKKLFQDFTRKDKFMIRIKNRIIKRIAHSYSEAKLGIPLAIFDSFDMLEISINQDNASKFLQSKIGTKVSIEK